MEFIARLFPYLLKMVGLAEVIFSKEKSGRDKKAFVVEAAKTVVDGVEAVSTGGQKETWERIGPSVDLLIEGAVGVAFKNKE